MPEIKENTLADETFKDAALDAVDSTMVEHDPGRIVIGEITDFDRQTLAEAGIQIKNGKSVDKQTGSAVLHAMTTTPTGNETGQIDVHPKFLDDNVAGHQIEAHTDTTPDKAQQGERSTLDAVSEDAPYH